MVKPRSLYDASRRRHRLYRNPTADAVPGVFGPGGDHSTIGTGQTKARGGRSAQPQRRQRPVAPTHPRPEVLPGARAELPRVGAGGEIVAGQENRAAGVDRRDALDDFQLGSIGPAGPYHVTDAEEGPRIEGAGNHQRARGYSRGPASRKG